MSRHLTLMFTDIQGFTARVSGSSRDEVVSLRERHAHLLEPVFRHFDGVVVKEIGDAYLVRFDSATNAVMCGVALQEVLRQYNPTVGEPERILVRVAINAGDVELEAGGDVIGEPVNIAARLEAIAEPGEVFFTEAVYLAMNRAEAPAAAVGEHTFKGIPYPIKVFQVVQPPNSPLRQRVHAHVRLTPRGPVITGFAAPARRRRKGWIAAAAVAAVAVLAFWLTHASAGDRALRDARAAGDAATALDIAAAGLAAEPGHAELRAFALDRARARLAELRGAGGGAALAWLRTALERRPFLEPLRSHVPVLDAEATADAAASADDPLAACYEVVKRYPDSAEVPAALADRLRGRLVPAIPLLMYEEALRRGHPPDDGLFDWIRGLYAEHHAGHLREAFDILERHYAERWPAWAQRELETTESPLLLDNVVTLLKDRPGFDPYYAALAQALEATSRESFEKSLEVVAADPDPGRRARAVALFETKAKEHASGRRAERYQAALAKLRGG